ncbi:zinc ion binding protein [Reticulomyxa filosa]|uniref:Zinc ion binding protein n=1 Tax=Reticulomyxa filosa TaxID=46433 RepID=X6NJ89_RETFI|nr:zinc ion binding protein [Reticulomyxa filosa]|eukprot:ETO25809.1 zinc ion binding protein [Reticulomyxa filosa]
MRCNKKGITNNPYANKYFEVMERLTKFPSLVKLIRLGELDITKILNVSNDEIMDATRKTDTNAKLLQQLFPLVGNALAEEILQQARQYSKKDKTKYRDKIRDLMFNLNKNPKLVQRLTSGNMTAEQLVHATNEELASEEISQYRNKVRKEIAQAQIIHEKLTDLKREGIIKKQVEVKPDDIPLSESIVKDMDTGTTVGMAVNNSNSNLNANSTNSNNHINTANNTTNNDNKFTSQSQPVSSSATVVDDDSDESSEDDDDLILEVVTKATINRANPSDNDVIDITNDEKDTAKDKKGNNSMPKPSTIRSSVIETIRVKPSDRHESSQERMEEEDKGVMFANRHSDSESETEEEEPLSPTEMTIPMEMNMHMDAEDDNVDFVGLFDESSHRLHDSGDSKQQEAGEVNETLEDSQPQLSTLAQSKEEEPTAVRSSSSNDNDISNSNKDKAMAEDSKHEHDNENENEKNKNKEQEESLGFLNVGPLRKPSRKGKPQKSKHGKTAASAKEYASPKEGKDSDKHLLWKGMLEYRDGNGKASSFKCKMHQIGGALVQRLPIPSKITMTGRVNPQELQKHLLKVLPTKKKKNHSKNSMKYDNRKVCCLSLSVIAEHEKVASECEKYLRTAERCARFKLDGKNADPIFDLYLMSPAVPHVNADFVKQYYKCHLPRHTLWALAVFPTESFAKITQDTDAQPPTSTKS